MSKLEDAVRSTIMRIVHREMRSVAVPLARDVRELKRATSSLRQSVAALERLAAEQVRQQQAELSRLEAPAEEVKGARFSPALIRKLRARLGLTQAQLAALVGVSTGAVTQWERGETAPRGANRAALVAVRKLGRRDVKKLLAAKPAAKPAEKPKRRKAARRKKASRKKSAARKGAARSRKK